MSSNKISFISPSLGFHENLVLEDGFPLRYTIDPYYGCDSNCVYCPTKERTSFTILGKDSGEIISSLPTFSTSTTVGMGGGPYDPLGDIDEKFGYTHSLLKHFQKNKILPFLMSKHLKKLKREEVNIKKLVLISSFTTIDNELAKILEPKIESPLLRMNELKGLKELGAITCACITPIIIGINDSPLELHTLFYKAKEANVDYVLFGMGDYDTYLRVVPSFNKFNQENILNKNDFDEALKSCFKTIIKIVRELKLNIRIPLQLIKNYLSKKDMAGLILSQMYYYSFYMEKQRNAYRQASYTLHQLNDKDFEYNFKRGTLQKLKGVGGFIEKIIVEPQDKENPYLEKIKSVFYS